MSLRGLATLLGAALAFSIMSVLVKLAGERLPSPVIVLARALVTAVIGYASLRAARLDWRGHNKRMLWLRSLFGFLALVLFFTAVTRLPLAEATTIHYLNPVLVAVIARVLLQERVGMLLPVALACGIAGTLLVARPSFLFGSPSHLDPIGVLCALGSAMSSAAAYVSVRRMADDDHALVIVFWFAAVSLPLSALVALPGFVMPAGREWLLLLGVGVVTQIGQILLTRGLQLVPAGRATAIGYTQIVFATGWGALLFGDKPHGSSIAGTALIFLGAGLCATRGGATNPSGVAPVAGTDTRSS